MDDSIHQRLLAMEIGTMNEPLQPRGWNWQNAMYAALGGLASISHRTMVLPAWNCTYTRDSYMEPGRLPSRCFWQVHHGAEKRCLYRISWCDQDQMATPQQLDDAIAAIRAARALPPPVLEVDFSSKSGVTASKSVIQSLLGQYAEEPVVLIRLIVPEGNWSLAKEGTQEVDGTKAPYQLVDHLQEYLDGAHPQMGKAVGRFRFRCADLTHRAKAGRTRECTNAC